MSQIQHRRLLHKFKDLTPVEVNYNAITHLLLPTKTTKQSMDTPVTTTTETAHQEVLESTDIVTTDTQLVLSEQQNKFLEAYFDPKIGGDAELAKEIAGYSDGTSIYYLMNKLSDEIAQRTSQFLAFHAPKAAIKLIGALDNPLARGTKEIIAASREILDRGGVIKKEMIEVKSDSPMNIVVLPPKQQH